MRNRIVLVVCMFIIGVACYLFVSGRSKSFDYYVDNVSDSSGSEEYDYVPAGYYCELVDFNTFTDDEIQRIMSACDEYIGSNNLYEDDIVTCSFYCKNEDGTIKINIIGTDVYFDVSIMEER